MEIFEDSELIMLTAEDIRYARYTQLAVLTGFDPSNFAAWSSSRGISERNLERVAELLRIPKLTFLEGLELRRKDLAMAREVQRKLDQMIALNQQVAS